MKKLFLLVAVLLQGACMQDTSDPAMDGQPGPVASAEDFRVAAGTGWKGHLSYLDYSSGSISKIPVEVEISEPKGRTLTYSIKYPGETQHNATEKLKFSRDGRKLDGEWITAREQNEDGDLVLVTTVRGEDDNRPADIRVTYKVGSAKFSITKEVRFEGESEFFQRNQYSLTR